MAVEITAADRDRIIRDTAKAGKPVPSWVASDPKLRAIFDAATPAPAGTIPSKSERNTTPQLPRSTKREAATSPRKPAATPAAGKRGPSGKGKGSARGSGRAGKSSPRPAGPIPLPRTLSKAAGGSAAGGLFLAIFLYPIALSIFQNGGAGFGMWLRAKFLNQTVKPSSIPQPTDGGGPLGKIQGGIVPKNDPAVIGPKPSVNKPGVAGQTPSPLTPVMAGGWANMMKNRQRITG